MATQFKFPNGIDIFEPQLINNITIVNADHINDLRNSIKKIQEYLIIDSDNLFDGYIIKQNQSILSALKTVDGYLSIINNILDTIDNNSININNIFDIINRHINTKQAHLSDGYLVDTNSQQILTNKIIICNDNLQISPKIIIENNLQEKNKKQIIIKDSNGLETFWIDGNGNVKCNNITYNNVEILNAQVTSDYLIVDGYCIIGRQNNNTDYFKIYADTELNTSDLSVQSTNININSINSNIVTSNLNISGNVNINNNLRIYGDTTIGDNISNTLSVLSAANFYNPINISNNLNINNSLTQFNSNNIQLSTSNINISSHNIDIVSNNININSNINIIKDINVNDINSRNIIANSITLNNLICNEISAFNNINCIDGYVNNLHVNDGYFDNFYLNGEKYNIPKTKIYTITNNSGIITYTHDLNFPFIIQAYIKDNNTNKLYPIDITSCIISVDNNQLIVNPIGFNINNNNPMIIICKE